MREVAVGVVRGEEGGRQTVGWEGERKGWKQRREKERKEGRGERRREGRREREGGKRKERRKAGIGHQLQVVGGRGGKEGKERYCRSRQKSSSVKQARG